MGTNFVSYQTPLLGAEVSQDPLDRFKQFLHQIVSIELQMINRPFFSDILRDIAMATNKFQKIRVFLRTNLLCRAAIRKEIAISQFQFQKIT